MTKFIPTEEYVLVQRANSDEKTAGGIILTKSAQEEKVYGTVIEASEESPFDVDDIVYFGVYGGIPIELDGEEFLIVRIKDIYGKLIS